MSELEGIASNQKQRLSNAEMEIVQLNNTIAAKQALANEHLASQQQQHSEQLQALNKKLDQSEIANSDQNLKIRELQNDSKVLEKQRRSSEDEVNSLRSQHKTHQLQYEDTLRKSVLAKDKAEMQHDQLKSANHELKLKCDALQQDLEAQKKLRSQLNQVAEMKEEMAKMLHQTQLQLKECQKSKDEQTSANERLRQEMKHAEANLSSQARSHEAQLKQKDSEISTLKNNTQLKEQHWQQMCEKDAQRLAVLKSACMAYFQGNAHDASTFIQR